MTPLQLGTQEYVNTQKNLLAIVASQPFYKTLVIQNKSAVSKHWIGVANGKC